MTTKLIVGFGNPGASYDFTRHNLGFLALDFFLSQKNLTNPPKEKFKSHYQRLTIDNCSVFFIKPQTFYNNIGTAVYNFANYYKIQPENIFVICDDFYLPFGKIRLRLNGSSGGNNGLKSVINTLKTEDFPRLRIGTGNADRREKLSDTDFVLSKFTPDERLQLPSILEAAALHINSFISGKP